MAYRSEIVATPKPGPLEPNTPAKLKVKGLVSAEQTSNSTETAHKRSRMRLTILSAKQHPRLNAVKPVARVVRESLGQERRSTHRASKSSTPSVCRRARKWAQRRMGPFLNRGHTELSS